MPPVCPSSDPESFCKSVDVEFKLLFIIMNYYFNEAFNKKRSKSHLHNVVFTFLLMTLWGDFTSEDIKSRLHTRAFNVKSNESQARTLHVVSPEGQRRGP